MNAERTKQRLLALGYTEADLKVPRPLTEEEFRGMTPDLQEWQLLANGNAVQKLDAEIAKREAEAARIDDADADRFWGRASQEEVNATLEMAAKFCRKYPQFVQAEGNTQQVVEWLKAHRVAKPTMSDFENAFAALCRAGSISIDLGKIPGENEGIISGYELRVSPVLWKILTPVTLTKAENEKREIDTMSADDFLRATPELHEKRISPIFKAQFDKAVATLESFHPEYERTDSNNKILLDYIGKHQAGLPFDATQLLAAFDAVKDQLDLKSNVATHGATRVVEYEPRRSTSELLDQTKLKKKIQSMSASEYSAWLRENPSGRNALDALA
jgi:hypothetical protein